MLLTPMRHQTIVSLMALPSQPFHFCGTHLGIASDCSGEVPHGVLEKADQVLIVTHQRVAGLADHGRPISCYGGYRKSAKHRSKKQHRLPFSHRAGGYGALILTA